MNSLVAGRRVVICEDSAYHVGFIRVVDDASHEVLVELADHRFLWLSEDNVYIESHLSIHGVAPVIVLVYTSASQPDDVALEFPDGALAVLRTKDVSLQPCDSTKTNVNDLCRYFNARRHNEECFNHSVSIEHCLVRYFDFQVNKFQTNTVIRHDQKTKELTICGTVTNVVIINPARSQTILEGLPCGDVKYTRRSRKECILWEAFGLPNPDIRDRKVEEPVAAVQRNSSKRRHSPLRSSSGSQNRQRQLANNGRSISSSSVSKRRKSRDTTQPDSVTSMVPPSIVVERPNGMGSINQISATCPSPPSDPLAANNLVGDDRENSEVEAGSPLTLSSDQGLLSAHTQYSGSPLCLPRRGSTDSDADSSVTSSCVSNTASSAAVGGGLFSDQFVSTLMAQLKTELATRFQSHFCQRVSSVHRRVTELRQQLNTPPSQPDLESVVPSPASLDQGLGSQHERHMPGFVAVGLACGNGTDAHSLHQPGLAASQFSAVSALVTPLAQDVALSISRDMDIFSRLQCLEDEVTGLVKDYKRPIRLPIPQEQSKDTPFPASAGLAAQSASAGMSEQYRRRRCTGAFPQELPCHVYPSKFSGEGGVDRCRSCREHLAVRRHTAPKTGKGQEQTTFCAFVGFRKLQVLNGIVKSAGFCTVDEATMDSLDMFRTHRQCSAFSGDQGKYVMQCLRPVALRLLNDELCHADAEEVCLKALGYREVCDICATTVFNAHFVCERCGAVVCLKCDELHRSKQGKGRDLDQKSLHLQQSGGWKCTRGDHILLLTQVIPTYILKELHQQICSVASLLSLCSPKSSLLPVSLLVDCECVYLEDCVNVDMDVFRSEWSAGKPVVIGNVHHVLQENWSPEGISAVVGPSNENADVVDCSADVRCLCRSSVETFWEGFQSIDARIACSSTTNIPLLKLKDWPTKTEFKSVMPDHYADLMAHLPVQDYTHHLGLFNLSARLPDEYVLPDLGPKMYISYGTSVIGRSTTNLHLDVSDAVNVIVNATSPSASSPEGVEFLLRDRNSIERVIERQNSDIQRRCCSRIPGALWHIYSAGDTDKIREFLRDYFDLPETHDPVHDQCYYLTEELRLALREKKGVIGFEIVQCLGDAIFIPAGAPHQVQNLNSCIKVAEDFVSPEHITQCVSLTDEFRYLTDDHTNHEDKLQVSSIIYHAVKEAVSAVLPLS